PGSPDSGNHCPTATGCPAPGAHSNRARPDRRPPAWGSRECARYRAWPPTAGPAGRGVAADGTARWALEKKNCSYIADQGVVWRKYVPTIGWIVGTSWAIRAAFSRRSSPNRSG